jgi:hypothetical protein
MAGVGSLGYSGITGGNVIGGRAFRGTSVSKSPSSQLAAAAKRQFMGGSSGIGGGGAGGGGGSVPSIGGTTNVGTNTAYVDAYNKILARLEGGGAALEGDIADIEAGKKAAIAAGEQNIVSSGLSGTTVMAGVPIAAEATAARARLQARGEAENKYLTALSNFANLAFQAEEGRLSRQAGFKSQQMSIANRPPTGSSIYVPESERYTFGAGYDTSGTFVGTSGQPSTVARGSIGAGYYGNYSSQYPNLYGQIGDQPPIPNWAG